MVMRQMLSIELHWVDTSADMNITTITTVMSFSSPLQTADISRTEHLLGRSQQRFFARSHQEPWQRDVQHVRLSSIRHEAQTEQLFCFVHILTSYTVSHLTAVELNRCGDSSRRPANAGVVTSLESFLTVENTMFV